MSEYGPRRSLDVWMMLEVEDTSWNDESQNEVAQCTYILLYSSTEDSLRFVMVELPSRCPIVMYQELVEICFVVAHVLVLLHLRVRSFGSHGGFLAILRSMSNMLQEGFSRIRGIW